jgi:hypothetical protein
MEEKNISTIILDTLSGKSAVKQAIYDVVVECFGMVKEVLTDLQDGYNNKLEKADQRLLLEFQDNGLFGAQIRVASDILIFSMHSNIFQFDRDHNIWKTSYVSEDHSAAYCGIINIYNFLADSFKYNRLADLGYLICRIFINKNHHFFVEGKRQQKYYYTSFGQETISRTALEEVINTAIGYALEFDLLVPPYDTVKLTTVEQAILNIEYSRTKTGKRLGFRFNSDDVSA